MSKIYRVNEFAKRIGKTTKTLRRWDETGKLNAKRQISGHRYYDESDVRKALGIKEVDRKTVVYCRVSSPGQKDDLQSQLVAMEQYCIANGIAVDEWITEIGGGMNFKRKKFLSIVSRVQTGEISRLFVAHKDRLMRFGFDLFEEIAGNNGCEVTVVNQESLSPQQEVVEDLMAIIHTFSYRLYGLRKYKKEIKKMVIET
ncbi:transposon resolvase [Candidatus Omnitrophus magneticus]|uniref:Transposon resolvase n=1 Tax=Candidatus Omnitrophus magneticus TaxID=1609969 RepID=A0A0F0CPQ3_9BACT|nr:transposon resolvase [Candidatus Omnitrophus magneticus]